MSSSTPPPRPPTPTNPSPRPYKTTRGGRYTLYGLDSVLILALLLMLVLILAFGMTVSYMHNALESGSKFSQNSNLQELGKT